MKEEDRNPEERRREERQREDEEVQHRKTAEDDAIYHEGLRSGDRSHWLAKGGDVSSIESSAKRHGPDDEVSILAPIDKQAWQQEAIDAVQEAQQSLWASILYLSRTRNSSRETQSLNEVISVTTLSADDEKSVGMLDRYIQWSEMNYRFSDLTKDLRWLKSKIQEYRLVKDMAAQQGEHQRAGLDGMRRVSPRIDRVVRSIMPSSTFAAYSVSGHDMKVPNPCFIGNLSDWCTSSQALGLEHPQLSWPIAAHDQLWWIHGRRDLPEPRHERSEFQYDRRGGDQVRHEQPEEMEGGTRRVGSFVADRKL